MRYRFQLLAVLVVLVTVGLGSLAFAARGVSVMLDNVSAASGTSGEVSTPAAKALRVQACGTGFSGTLSIKQGEMTAKLTETKAVTLTLNSDCSTYYDLKPSSLVEVTYTRTAGSVTVYLGAD